MRNRRMFFGVRRLGRSVGALLWLAMASGCGGGESGPAEGGAAALRERFPGQAAKVLGDDASEALQATDEGFVPRVIEPGRGTWRSLSAVLPHKAQDGIKFETPGGFSIRVFEVGANGAGNVDEKSVRYTRPGGSAFWTVTGSGFEEWLHLGADVVRDDAPVAAWEVEGGEVRQSGDAVEIADAEGKARIRVTAPVAYGADGREIGVRIAAGEKRIEVFVEANGEEVLLDPAWTSISSMLTGRMWHAAALLDTGDVLVSGGLTVTPPGGTAIYTATAEKYNPSSGQWTPAGTMHHPRYFHAMVKLEDGTGRVLAAGGAEELTNPYVGQGTSELYDPNTNSWSGFSLIGTNHWSHPIMAWIPSTNEVLLVGGSGGGTSANLFNPQTNTWRSATPSLGSHASGQAVRIDNSHLMIVGGNTPEIYDVGANSWTLTGPAQTTTGTYAGAVMLSGGRVLLASGQSAEVWDPATNVWSPTGALKTGHEHITLSKLSTGKALLVGGMVEWDAYGNVTNTTAELYDPVLNSWSYAQQPVWARSAHTATSLADANGRILFAGGMNFVNGSNYGTNLSPEIYDPTQDPNATAPTLFANGSACSTNNQCQSSFCTDGVCCNAACNAGACDACSIAAGGSANGTCTLLTGNACNDGNACTQSDTCQSGTCTGSSGVTCTASDQCHDAGTCDPATGACSNPAKANGASCNDGNACTQSDTCQSGTCTSGNAVTCTASDQCHDAGTCDPATGNCSNPSKANGTSCTDNNACTLSDTCQSGACQAGSPKVCTPPVCQVNAACDPANGTCTFAPAADGTACPEGSCEAGACVLIAASPSVPLAPLAAFSAGGSHSLALLEDGTLLSWGSDQNGQIGVPGANTARTAPGIVSLPVPVLVDPSLTTIAAGGKHSLAVLADGTIAAWGSDFYGQIGNDAAKVDVIEAPAVFSLPGGIRALAVAAGVNHSLVIDENYQVWSFGMNLYGQLGKAGVTPSAVPTAPIAGLNGIVAIAAGADHSYALDANGVVWSWGRDVSGQLGDSATSSSGFAPRVVTLPAATPAIAIASGNNHGIALLADYSVYTWGSDSNGQLGDGGTTPVNKFVPVKVTTITGAYAVAAGGNNSLVLRFNGSMASFGDDASGQLGDDATFTQKFSPATVLGGTTYTPIFAAGSAHSLLSTTDAKLWSAGNDTSGQLGNGPALINNQPTPFAFTLTP